MGGWQVWVAGKSEVLLGLGISHACKAGRSVGVYTADMNVRCARQKYHPPFRQTPASRSGHLHHILFHGDAKRQLIALTARSSTCTNALCRRLSKASLALAQTSDCRSRKRFSSQALHRRLSRLPTRATEDMNLDHLMTQSLHSESLTLARTSDCSSRRKPSSKGL